MTRRQFRQLIAILAFKRIPFKWSRNNGVYSVQFPDRDGQDVIRAAGA